MREAYAELINLERDIMRSYALGSDAYVIKTPDFNDLVRAICKLADLRRVQRESQKNSGARNAQQAIDNWQD